MLFRRTRHPRVLSTLLTLGALVLGTAACGDGGEAIDGRIVEVGCGLCQYHLEGRSDCYWAVRIDDEMVMARGDALPSDDEHDSHAPTGMCSVTRQARVSGTLYETYFLATEFELLPPPEGATTGPHEHVH